MYLSLSENNQKKNSESIEDWDNMTKSDQSDQRGCIQQCRIHIHCKKPNIYQNRLYCRLQITS